MVRAKPDQRQWPESVLCVSVSVCVSEYTSVCISEYVYMYVSVFVSIPVFVYVHIGDKCVQRKKETPSSAFLYYGPLKNDIFWAWWARS